MVMKSRSPSPPMKTVINENIQKSEPFDFNKNAGTSLLTA